MTKNARLAVVTKNRTNPAYGGALVGATRIAEGAGATIDYFAPETPDSIPEQIALLKKAAKGNYDAMLVMPAHESELDETLEQIMADGTPKVIEFNCRMGDPETQPILMRLKSDLAALCFAALDGTLGQRKAEWDERAALGVVMAAGGYPGSYAKGSVIDGLDEADSDTQKVFHAGTSDVDGNVVTNGGRVLCVVGLGDSVAAAATTAYAAVERIHWDGAHLRRDIGHRAIARERT